MQGLPFLILNKQISNLNVLQRTEQSYWDLLVEYHPARCLSLDKKHPYTSILGFDLGGITLLQAEKMQFLPLLKVLGVQHGLNTQSL